MEREAYSNLLQWKNNPSRKPLLVRGARQVGKTWLIKEFGQHEYAKVAYVNFERSKYLQNLFAEHYDIDRIITVVQIETGVQVNATDTLIVFDEIQEAQGGLSSLKYFQENAPQYHVIAAGSLLGVACHNQISFPVGKIEFLDLYPLSFAEFLLACGQKPLRDLLQSKDWEMILLFKDKYIHFLRQYYFVGGMPEVVNTFILSNDFCALRTIQKQILT
ncbi:MAG TPA: AAA family ATPase [Prolixibacteraceae bacterium]|nr:AAA family ATPase [Prolixibacteraceae bacterium]HOR99779.1 AAA family ATPase [Prolixibacteraceae bacterium]HOS89669.1 AAA family ATPase [Prolixibacteraceae bacterium]HPL44671.1 AAA family ATPase [Prolixibacteraceae bacterium]HQE51410.1 AAA family ATPase [Prolixibacteraceae bacterium]